ncbi:MAG: DUF1501 domain-containing protein [Fuerstiella sp.]|nr:DUF1501 domain-containing protein [Fuerstiella sp.]MCP4512902.1 DUF1501 domain-containing protein [Fuerstiella sp.]
MNMWFAGGAARQGTFAGAADEIDTEAAEVVYPVHDMHVPMPNLRGLNDSTLSCFR